VVVVLPSASVVVVVERSSSMLPGIDDSTGRNRSSAVSPTISMARCWFFTPGSWTTIESP
jgi:hypothetical protein